MTERDISSFSRLVGLTELNQAYADSLDSGDLAAWPDFFTTDGVYKAQGRENFDRGLPLAAMLCDGRCMLDDRVTVISQIMVYAPRSLREMKFRSRVAVYDSLLIPNSLVYPL